MQTLTNVEEAIFSPLLRKYTLEEFFALPTPEGRSHYDLIGGYLFMVPPPDPPHGSLDSRMTKSLIEFLLSNNIAGELHHPREPIYTDIMGGTYLEPDMMYVSAELGERMGTKRTSADIVFEYLSKTTANYDRTTKSHTYLALGVRELWLIDPDAVTIELLHPISGTERPSWHACRYVKGDLAESMVLAGWRVSVDELFAGLI